MTELTINNKYDILIDSINNFDTLNYFKYNFKEFIKYFIDLNKKDLHYIKHIFNLFYKIFNIDFVIFLIKNNYLYDINNISNEERLNLINEFIDFYTIKYKNEINLYVNDYIYDKEHIPIHLTNTNIINNNEEIYIIFFEILNTMMQYIFYNIFRQENFIMNYEYNDYYEYTDNDLYIDTYINFLKEIIDISNNERYVNSFVESYILNKLHYKEEDIKYYIKDISQYDIYYMIFYKK